MAARSPIPGLCLQVLAADPLRDRPYTTTEVQQAVAGLRRNVTRDTIAHHLRAMGAGWRTDDTRLVAWFDGPGEHAWRLTTAGWHEQNHRVLDLFAFCESEAAITFPTWHIRQLTEAGRKPGGGIDSQPLCGRTGFKGWDLEAPVTLATAFDGARRRNQRGGRDVCLSCADALPEVAATAIA